MKEISKEEFDNLLSELAEKNSIVKDLLAHMAYNDIPIHLRSQIEDLLGIEIRVAIFKK
jgi:hypothetical protein